MKEQVLRILRMVKEGKLTPEDAYELLSAFVAFDSEPEQTEIEHEKRAFSDEPFRRFIDYLERMTKETMESVNWREVAEQVRMATQKGMETLRASVEGLGKGEFLFFMRDHETTSVDLPFEIRPGKTLYLECTHCDVKIVGGYSEARIHAKATIRGESREDVKERAAKWTPVLEESADSITLKQSPLTIFEELEIHIPKGVKLNIKLDHGDVEVKDTGAEVRISARSGDIEVQGAEGEVVIGTLGGDVEVSNTTGNIEIDNPSSGDVELNSVSGNIKVNAANGDIEAKGIAGENIVLETVNGDIDVQFSKPITGSVSLRTVSGDILLDLVSGNNCRCCSLLLQAL
ncbi:MAG TPA: DUF4097 family beta strand repeat-containing protein [Fimbriimonadales bacterium]|nr:DUF4097 family beta strand repeat-containing protein [Fimbriimonadales bacterium]